MENKIPISEWKTGVDEKGGYWIEPNTNKKWRWESNGEAQIAIGKINKITQTNKIQWTENKLWTISSIFFITLLLLGWFYPMIVLSMCVIALGAMLLYFLVWLGTLLLKEILGLDDE